MGDLEELVAEPDEEVVEGVDGQHPPTLTQQNPWLIAQTINIGIAWIAANGWFALGFVLLSYVLWVKLQPKLMAWKKKREDDEEIAAHHKDPDKFITRERQMDLARQKMQNRYSQEAMQWAEKKKEELKKQEEIKRAEHIEDWERHERGEGYRSKSRLNATPSAGATGSSTSTSEENKKSGKPKLKPEYNPMTGDVGDGSCRWRPDRRGTSGGG